MVDNADGELMPGGSANVHVDLVGGAGSFRIPVSALIFDQAGLRVATVGADDRVALKTVTIARDLGSEIEIGSGLQADDRVVAAPPGRDRRGRPGSHRRRQVRSRSPPSQGRRRRRNQRQSRAAAGRRQRGVAALSRRRCSAELPSAPEQPSPGVDDQVCAVHAGGVEQDSVAATQSAVVGIRPPGLCERARSIAAVLPAQAGLSPTSPG